MGKILIVALTVAALSATSALAADHAAINHDAP